MESEEEVMMSYNAYGELETNTDHKLEQDEKRDHKCECSLTITMQLALNRLVAVTLQVCVQGILGLKLCLVARYRDFSFLNVSLSVQGSAEELH
jgi:hypothetical protein